MTASADIHASLGRIGLIIGLHNETFRDVTSGGSDPFAPMNSVPAGRSIVNNQSGRIGFHWKQGHCFSVFSNLGKYYRSPSLNEKFGGGGGVLPNPSLQSEDGISVEGGLKYAGVKNYLEAI